MRVDGTDIGRGRTMVIMEVIHWVGLKRLVYGGQDNSWTNVQKIQPHRRNGAVPEQQPLILHNGEEMELIARAWTLYVHNGASENAIVTEKLNKSRRKASDSPGPCDDVLPSPMSAVGKNAKCYEYTFPCRLPVARLDEEHVTTDLPICQCNRIACTFPDAKIHVSSKSNHHVTLYRICWSVTSDQKDVVFVLIDCEGRD